MIDHPLAEVLGRYCYELGLLLAYCPDDADEVRAAHSEHFSTELGISIDADDVDKMSHLAPHVARFQTTGPNDVEKLFNVLENACRLCACQSATIATGGSVTPEETARALAQLHLG